MDLGREDDQVLNRTVGVQGDNLGRRTGCRSAGVKNRFCRYLSSGPPTSPGRYYIALSRIAGKGEVKNRRGRCMRYASARGRAGSRLRWVASKKMSWILSFRTILGHVTVWIKHQILVHLDRDDLRSFCRSVRWATRPCKPLSTWALTALES